MRPFIFLCGLTWNFLFLFLFLYLLFGSFYHSAYSTAPLKLNAVFEMVSYLPDYQDQTNENVFRTMPIPYDF